jgi:DivIVA domain-containing protein
MTDLHRRAAASAARLTPEEIAARGFAQAFRGFSETEVRNFLKRVSDEVAAMGERESGLADQVRELEDRLRHPAPVTEQQLLDNLGEETARVLRSAQDAANEIRSRAEERAATLVREAQDEASALRESSERQATARLEDADRRATEREQSAATEAATLRDDSEREARELHARTEREIEEARAAASALAESDLESAKANGRAMVEEAREVRERVLADLDRRRGLLQEQIDELRAGRDRLLDAYRVVKRTLGEATDALADVEQHATAQLGGVPPGIDVPPVTGEMEVLGIAGGAEAEPANQPGSPQSEPSPPDPAVPAEQSKVAERSEPEGQGDGGEISVDLTASEPTNEGSKTAGETNDEGDGGADSGAAVDALFARLRSSGGPDDAAAGSVTASPVATEVLDRAESPAPRATNGEGTVTVVEETVVIEATAEPEAKGEASGAPEEELTGDDALRSRRLRALRPLSRELGRRAKRSLQDEQNELLDRLRTAKGKPVATEMLAAPDEREASWADVIRGPLGEAYAAARTTSGRAGTKSGVPDEIVTSTAHLLVDGLRGRLLDAIDGVGDNIDEIPQRIGARYRDFRTQELDAILGDSLSAAWARGTFDAAPKRARLRWVPDTVGSCPDCDDNALEPTAKGQEFPTGQAFPPAHPGCRCLLAIDDVTTGR